MQQHLRARQLPGRVDALRLVIRQGANNSSTELKQLAGMGKRHAPQPPRPTLPTFMFSSSIERITPAERAQLPF